MTKIPTATTIHVAMNGTITLRSSQFGIHGGYAELSLGAIVAVELTYKSHDKILRTFLRRILATQDANHNNGNNDN